jgi:hypothetical protein
MKLATKRKCLSWKTMIILLDCGNKVIYFNTESHFNFLHENTMKNLGQSVGEI